MENKEIIYSDCKETYERIYSGTKESIAQTNSEKSGKKNFKKIISAAHKKAIKETAEEVFEKYQKNIGYAWKCILNTAKDILGKEKEKTDSAQSCKTISGDAFEQYVCDKANSALAELKGAYTIFVETEKDFRKRLEQHALLNPPEDQKELAYHVKGKKGEKKDVSFDAFLIMQEEGSLPLCFGAIQIKASTRERFKADLLPMYYFMRQNFLYLLCGSRRERC